MTAIMTCSTLVPLARGESHAGQYVANRLDALRNPLRHSRSIGVQALLDDLSALAEECGHDDWNGYGAMAVKAEALANAGAFIRCLGIGMRDASLGASGSGCVTMQWGSSPRWTLALTITDDGWIHWAALFGAASECGTTPFMGTIPPRIVDLIKHARIA